MTEEEQLKLLLAAVMAVRKSRDNKNLLNFTEKQRQILNHCHKTLDNLYDKIEHKFFQNKKKEQ